MSLEDVVQVKETNPLRRFLEFQEAKGTRKTYRSALRRFFLALYEEADTSEEDWMESLASSYFEAERDYEEDVRTFIVSVQDLTPNTAQTYLAAVKSFLEDNGIYIPGPVWRRLGRKVKGEKVTLDRLPTDEELQRIFQHLPLRGRALYHLLATSGLRIGTVLKLKLDDVHLKDDHVQIDVRAGYEKSKKPFVAFASEETKDLLVEWLGVRDDYIEQAINRSRYREKQREDDRLFPFASTTARKLWYDALEAADLDDQDPETNWRKLHLHTLRMRARTKMAEAGVESNIAETLIGHRTYLETYKRFDVDTLLKHYKKAEPSLVFSSFSKSVQAVDEKVERLRKENAELREQLEIAQALTNEEQILSALGRMLDDPTKSERLHDLLKDAW